MASHRGRYIGSGQCLRWFAPALAAAMLAAGAGPRPAMAVDQDFLLDELQHTAFNFFWEQANPSNGLIRDRSQSWSPCSIASLGFGLTAITIGIDHGWVTREAGRGRILTALNTLWTKPQGSGTGGYIGYKGLYYHFLDMNTATRTWDCELSTIDTALLFAGIIDAKEYFDTQDSLDVQVRALADSIYYRADWEFARNFNPGILMGWKPGTGFGGYGQWIGYNEAMILYILALGSPTHQVPTTCWQTWTNGYQWNTYYGYSYVVFPPLFGHQYSHCWIDFRFQRDAYMQTKGITYFENSRRATYAQRAYCIANPFGRTGYGANQWGLTACDDPGGYLAHGAPPGQNDNGTLAPTAPGGAVAFTPEIAIPCLQNLYDTYYNQMWSTYGLKDAFNLQQIWWDTDYLGIDQGPIIIMIENYRNENVWRRFTENVDIKRGLQRAGFVLATAVEPPQVVPGEARLLMQNAPNPFRNSTTIPYVLPEGGRVELTVEDVSGRVVSRLVDGEQSAGPHAAELRGGDLPAGVYYYRLVHDGGSEQRRCVIVR